MESELALVTAHDSADEPPTAIDDGLPLKLEITGGGARTVTVMEDVVVPPAFVAVKMYVVVSVGCTMADVPVTAPTPGAMETEVALVTDQRSVVDCPGPTVDESAAKELITGGGVLFRVPPPPFEEHAATRISAAPKARGAFMAFLPASRRAR